MRHYGELSDGRSTLPVSFDEKVPTLPAFGEKIVATYELWVYNRAINLRVVSWAPVGAGVPAASASVKEKAA